MWKCSIIKSFKKEVHLNTIILQNSICTSEISWLMLFNEIIAVYSRNRTKHMNALSAQNAEFLNVEVGGIYSYHWAVKCQISLTISPQC
jgi:hypothetical protein